MKIIITGGAGFIGSELVRQCVRDEIEVHNLDALTYAGNLDSLSEIEDKPNYHFHHADIVNADKIKEIVETIKPDAILHLAAESHVDRSIDGPSQFIQTNIIGTFNLLQTSLAYWQTLEQDKKESFRFLHVSTDEVFGSLGTTGFFSETTPYQPSSPYSASKASSDHLVRAWFHTYDLPIVMTNCSNNYGPYHFPEKLIPLVILNALDEKKLPVYGKGEQVRDWLFVSDHAKAIRLVLSDGKLGESYNIGGHQEKQNIEVVQTICRILDEIKPRGNSAKYEELIEFVADRPGHDLRYAIDSSKISNELGWKAEETFETGIRKTIEWYLNHQSWWEKVRSGQYRGERLGLGAS